VTWRVDEGSVAHRGLRRARWAVLALVVLLVPVVVPDLQLHLAWETATWAVAVLGLNIAVGFAGQISLGHAAFAGVGAYTCVILSADHDWPLLATVPAAGAVSFAVGFVIGVPALRFRGLYLALLTLAVGTAFGPIVKRLDWLTNGTNGKGSSAELTPPSWFGTGRQAERVWVYLIVVAFAVVMFVLVSNLVTGRMGRALEAMRSDELSAQTFGVNVPLLKMTMFGLSAAVTGVAGAMLMLPSPFATDNRFSQALSFQLYTAVFVGGIGTLSGCVVGGAVIALLPVATTALGITIEPGLVFGAALVAVTLFFPDGLMGGWQRARDRWFQVVPRHPARAVAVAPAEPQLMVEIDLPPR
jgi:branched-chain amino acid transport system permease protein